MLKKLISLLFQSKHVAAPVSDSDSVSSRSPVGERNGGVSLSRRTPPPLNGNHRRISNGHNRHSDAARFTNPKLNAPHEQGDFRNANHLLRDGHLRVGLVGCNLDGFAIQACTRSDDTGLAKEIADLPTQIKMVRRRDLAGGLRVALQMLARSTQGRTGIVILTSGESTSNPILARELVETAAKWRTGVHVIQIGHANGGRQALADLATRPSLGYGQFRNVETEDELLEALRGALDGLAPARGMTGINSAVVLVDLSERMAESFQGTTRIEMVVEALQEHLRQPLVRPSEKRLAWAA